MLDDFCHVFGDSGPSFYLPQRHWKVQPGLHGHRCAVSGAVTVAKAARPGKLPPVNTAWNRHARIPSAKSRDGCLIPVVNCRKALIFKYFI